MIFLFDTGTGRVELLLDRKGAVERKLDPPAPASLFQRECRGPTRIGFRDGGDAVATPCSRRDSEAVERRGRAWPAIPKGREEGTGSNDLMEDNEWNQ